MVPSTSVCLSAAIFARGTQHTRPEVIVPLGVVIVHGWGHCSNVDVILYDLGWRKCMNGLGRNSDLVLHAAFTRAPSHTSVI